MPIAPLHMAQNRAKTIPKTYQNNVKPMPNHTKIMLNTTKIITKHCQHGAKTMLKLYQTIAKATPKQH